MSDAYIPAVMEFSAIFSDACSSANTPVGLTEALMPDVSKTSWLLTTSNALVGATESLTLRMVLERALPQGVAIALDVVWKPDSWGLKPGSRPTPEVLRRFRPLAQAATLIRCTPDEADEFFSSRNPLAIQGSLAQRPGVVITGNDGSVQWCIGGRMGAMGTLMLNEQKRFLRALLENLADNPELLGNAGPGSDAVADADRLTDALLAAASR